MQHPSNRELYRYWNERRGARPAPERTDIEPGAIRRVLGDTFVLEPYSGIGQPFRIAGTRLCALLTRELKGESFIGLWRRPDQAALRDMIDVIMEEKTGVIASVTAATADDLLQPIALEMLLLPLAYQFRADARMVGAIAPIVAPYWLGTKTVGPLTLGSFRHVGPALDKIPAPRLRAATGRLRHGLTVYDGGRTAQS
jgi:hypothetical protein